MADVEILGFAPSTYVRTARMAAHEKGVSHTLSPLEFQSASHTALHPFAKMPVLRHVDLVLYETMAIMVYLDAVFEGPALQPATPHENARMWQMVSIANDYAYPALVKDTLEETGLGGADQDVITLVLNCLDGNLQATSGATFADLFMAPMVAYHIGLAGGSDVFRQRPHLKAWYDDISYRASFVETDPS